MKQELKNAKQDRDKALAMNKKLRKRVKKLEKQEKKRLKKSEKKTVLSNSKSRAKLYRALNNKTFFTEH